MAAPLIEVRARRKQGDHLTIAHISDLHFDSQNTPDGDHFVSLQTEIVRSRVDMIIVTGDVADNPAKDIFDGLWDGKYTIKDLRSWLRLRQSLLENWLGNLKRTLGEAQAFLRRLCKAADVKYPELLCTIPGNHDLRIQGLVQLPLFGTVNLAVENTKNQPFTEIFETTSQDRLVSFSDGTTDSIISVAIVCFNSNGVDPVLNFATGKVGEDDLNRMRQLESDAQFQKAHKIVLMHHHPMPIPESEGTPGIKGVFGGDQFLLLKNAGVVMRELVRSKIDLVLHGHKHYSGFSHVNFNFPLPCSAGHEADVARHQVSVVGAGSAGIYSEGYTFNIIELYGDGRIYVQEKRRDHSGGYFPKRQFWLVNYEQKRIQRYDRCAESLQTELCGRAKKLVYSVSIEDDGDAIERRDFTGLQALDQERAHMPHVLRSVTGYLSSDEKPKVDFQDQYYTSIEWNPVPPGPVATAVAEPPGPIKIPGEICFRPSLSKEHPVDISVITPVCNAFDFIKEYRLGVTTGQADTEDVTCYDLLCVVLLDHLTIVVTFPEKLRKYNLSGKVRLKIFDPSGKKVDPAEWTTFR